MLRVVEIYFLEYKYTSMHSDGDIAEFSIMPGIPPLFIVYTAHSALAVIVDVTKIASLGVYAHIFLMK